MSDYKVRMESIPVSRREFLVMEAIQNGVVKAHDIIKATKMNYSSAMQILFEFKEVGWVIHNQAEHSYAIAEGVTFKPIELRNGCVREQEKEVRRERSILQSTYQERKYQNGWVDTTVKVSYWTPEQLEENEKRITQGKVIEKPITKGARWGESGHHFFRSG